MPNQNEWCSLGQLFVATVCTCRVDASHVLLWSSNLVYHDGDDASVDIQPHTLVIKRLMHQWLCYSLKCSLRLAQSHILSHTSSIFGVDKRTASLLIKHKSYGAYVCAVAIELHCNKCFDGKIFSSSMMETDLAVSAEIKSQKFSAAASVARHSILSAWCILWMPQHFTH